jgi:hypothetical protein
MWSTICKALLQLFSTVQSKLATLLILLYSNSNALHKNYEGKHLFCAVCEKVTKEKKKKKKKKKKSQIICIYRDGTNIVDEFHGREFCLANRSPIDETS